MINILKEKPSDRIFGRLLEADRFVENVDIKNKTILDIGCGFGWFEVSAIKRGVKKVVGIEHTKEDLATAKKGIKSKKIDFRIASAVKLPFEDKSFDTVVCFEVIEHIPENTENQMLAEINRVLKKNGVLYLSTPFNAIFARMFDPAWWLIGHRHYSNDSLRDYGIKNGFKVLRVYVKGGWWSIISSLNMFGSKWILRRKRLAENLFMEKENQEYKNKSGFVNIFIKYKKLK